MLCHCPRLVITSEHRDLFGVLQLQRKQVQTDLQTEDASVHIVAQEKQILSYKGQTKFDCLRSKSFRVNNFVEHVDHVVVLAVDVADNDNGLLDLHQVGLAF